MKLYKHIGKRSIVCVVSESESQAIGLIREALDSIGLIESDIDLPVEMCDIPKQPGIVFVIKRKG